MRHLSRVVWNEGMHLAQHHFQAQNRYVEDSLQFALAQLFFRPYGFVGFELDAESLRNGVVLLVHARGIMPDGLPFEIPGSDAAPEPIRIDDAFAPIRDSHLVQLAIPAFREGHPNTAIDGEPRAEAMRYRALTLQRPDDVTGRDERGVAVGRKNFRLVLDGDTSEGLVTLPIARVRRAPSGQFVFDPAYVPPVLQIGASVRLLDLLRRLVEVLDGKSDSMARGRRGAAGEFAPQEIASFWLLHTINAALAPLRHLLQTRQAHPEQLFLELSRLAGALCTFSLDTHPRSLPRYEHERLEECFDALDRHIRANLEIVAPAGPIVIALAQSEPSLWTGTIGDQRVFGRSRWFLGVRSSAPEHEVVNAVTQLVRVCTSKFVPKLVSRALPGLPLRHVPTPPVGITPRSDTVYFTLEKTGPCWETLLTDPHVGVHVPDAIPRAQLDLLVLPEE
jgi:type VI secretion system protein ImpJ